MNDKPASEPTEVVTSKGIGSSALLGSGLLTWEQHVNKQAAEYGTPTAAELLQMRQEIEKSARSA